MSDINVADPMTWDDIRSHPAFVNGFREDLYDGDWRVDLLMFKTFCAALCEERYGTSVTLTVQDAGETSVHIDLGHSVFVELTSSGDGAARLSVVTASEGDRDFPCSSLSDFLMTIRMIDIAALVRSGNRELPETA